MHCTSVHSSSLILLTESCMRLGCHKQIFTTKCRNQDKLYLILGFWSFTYVKSQNQRGWGGICYFYLGIEGNCIEGQLLSYRLFLGGMSFPKRPVDWVENEEGVASYESFMAASWDLNFHQGVQTVKPTTFFSLDSPSLKRNNYTIELFHRHSEPDHMLMYNECTNPTTASWEMPPGGPGLLTNIWFKLVII